MKKLKLSSKTYDWKDENKDFKAKAERLEALADLL